MTPKVANEKLKSMYPKCWTQASETHTNYMGEINDTITMYSLEVDVENNCDYKYYRSKESFEDAFKKLNDGDEYFSWEGK